MLQSDTVNGLTSSLQCYRPSSGDGGGGAEAR